MKKLVFAISALTLTFFSCSKDDDKDNACPVTKESIAGTYKIVSFKVNGIDAMDAQFLPCEQDDLVTLNANGTYVYDDAGVACDPNGDDTGTWDLTGNTFSIDIIPTNLTIQSFDCTNLTGTASFAGNNLEATFRKQ